MKKRIVTIALVVALMAICLGGTLAYLQDTNAAKNTMVIGNVDIEQNEWQRTTDADGNYNVINVGGKDSYELEAYKNDKPLYPATAVDAKGNPYNFGAGNYDPIYVRMSQVGSQGAMEAFDNINAVDKFVTVKNTGKSDAYVRTLIALEIGNMDVGDFGNIIRSSMFMLDKGIWSDNEFGVISLNGTKYYVSEHVYHGAAELGGVHENGVLPAGETTYCCLGQVYMTAAATNEDVVALDGNANGKYDILVLSQAVQAKGFDDAKTALDIAFGEITDANLVTWFSDSISYS